MVNDNIIIENARIGFRNFSGKEGKFNPAGRRNFCVFIDHDLAAKLSGDGWNIRYLQPRDPEDDTQAYIPVAVNFKFNPPKIVLVTKKSKTKLEEDEVNILDWAEIAKVDLTLRPYNWEVNGKTGVKAYLKTMYVTIVEDDFADKYGDIPEGASFDSSDFDYNGN